MCANAAQAHLDLQQFPFLHIMSHDRRGEAIVATGRRTTRTTNQASLCKRETSTLEFRLSDFLCNTARARLRLQKQIKQT